MRERLHFLLLNIGHFLDHLFTLIFATVAALALYREWGLGYADLLKYARNWLAADYLARNAGDSTKSSEFSRIGADDKRNAVDYLKKTNFVHVQIMRFSIYRSFRLNQR